MKICTKCGESKELEAFSWKVKGERRSSVCKECHKVYRKKHYEDNREKYIAKAKTRKARLGLKFEKYKLTDAQWAEMLYKYGGLCWICKEAQATQVDHDHGCCPGDYSCGDCVRGALCKPCNMGLGSFKDNVTNLETAVDYLKGSNP